MTLSPWLPSPKPEGAARARESSEDLEFHVALLFLSAKNSSLLHLRQVTPLECEYAKVRPKQVRKVDSNPPLRTLAPVIGQLLEQRNGSFNFLQMTDYE